LQFLAAIREKYKQKTQPAVFPTGCASKVLIIFFTANNRLPVGFYPSGHHQQLVFLRLICFMMLILNHDSLFLSRKIIEIQTNFLFPAFSCQ